LSLFHANIFEHWVQVSLLFYSMTPRRGLLSWNTVFTLMLFFGLQGAAVRWDTACCEGTTS
jgi:hypothetical protein